MVRVSGPVAATNLAGTVVLAMDPETARVLATAWQVFHCYDPVAPVDRPDWHDDLVRILAAAAEADGATNVVPITYATRIGDTP